MLSRLLISLSALSIAILSVGIWHVLDTPLRGFVIDGELSSAERAELQQVLTALPLDGVLSTPMASVTGAVSSLPWARNVNVRRQWPDKLVIGLRKAHPVARWGDSRYLSAYGDLLVLPDEYTGLPLFDVRLATPSQAMEVYRLLDEVLSPATLKISELSQNPQGEWRVHLARGPVVLLGSQRLKERMQRFMVLQLNILHTAERKALYVDTRYENGLAVRYEDAVESEIANGSVARSTGSSALLASGSNMYSSEGKSHGR